MYEVSGIVSSIGYVTRNEKVTTMVEGRCIFGCKIKAKKHVFHRRFEPSSSQVR
jgi:hypothetical protein